MRDFPDPTLLAIPAFIVFVGLEWWGVRKARVAGDYETKDAITSMAMGLGSAVSGILFGGVAGAISILAWNYKVAEIEFTVLSFVVLVLLNDFIYYWKHRAMHRVRWFWANHVVHHSSEHYNLTTALRQPWTGAISGLVIIGIPQILLGFHPAMVAFVGGINLLYQFWIHTEAIDRLPRWAEFVFNSPSHHRVHHGRNARYLDANYGGILIIWDRLFGTFVPELARDKPDYGLVEPLGTYNPFYVALHGYGSVVRDIAQDSWRVWRWPMRILAPPGWSPDGAHEGSKAFKAAYLEANPQERGTEGFKG